MKYSFYITESDMAGFVQFNVKTICHNFKKVYTFYRMPFLFAFKNVMFQISTNRFDYTLACPSLIVVTWMVPNCDCVERICTLKMIVLQD